MSLPIQLASPILTGKDAKRFIEKMKNVKPISKEKYLRAKKVYEEIKKKNPNSF
jgi:hypothetical protein